MRPCDVCGKELAEDAKVCPYCGHPLEGEHHWANKMGVVSLVLSIISCALSFLDVYRPIIYLLFLHHVGLLTMSIISHHYATNKGLCRVAIVFSSIGLGLFFIWCLVYAIR